MIGEALDPNSWLDHDDPTVLVPAATEVSCCFQVHLHIYEISSFSCSDLPHPLLSGNSDLFLRQEMRQT